jgi:hypothetical protein
MKNLNLAQELVHSTLVSQFGPFISEVLTLGVPDKEGHIILIQPGKEDAIVGGRVS